MGRSGGSSPMTTRWAGPGSASCGDCHPAAEHRDTEQLESVLDGQRRLARAVEDVVVRFRLPALLPFDREPGGLHRSNQAEVVSF